MRQLTPKEREFCRQAFMQAEAVEARRRYGHNPISNAECVKIAQQLQALEYDEHGVRHFDENGSTAVRLDLKLPDGWDDPRQEPLDY